jgi:hypothetical protein
MFRKHKGQDFMPPSMPDAIKWTTKDPYLEWKHSDIEWAIIKATGDGGSVPYSNGADAVVMA